MKEFNSLAEIKKYYNKKTNTYEFIENGNRLDVKFNFDLNIDANIIAGNIIARNINAYDILALDITTWDIKAHYIHAIHIEARNIDTMNIEAWDITANIIKYYAFCIAYYSITCQSIKGDHKNAKHFCLDGEIIIKGENDNGNENI